MGIRETLAALDVPAGTRVYIDQDSYEDLWLEALQQKRASAGTDRKLMTFPELTATRDIAHRISANQALENLQVIEELHQLLHTNVQEALALEVNLLKMHL